MQLLLVALIMLVVSYVIQSFLVKRPKVKPAALEDWDFAQSDDGTPEPVIFGDVWVSPMVLWYGNYRTIKIKAEGGKK
jgi:hypothetical protein